MKKYVETNFFINLKYKKMEFAKNKYVQSAGKYVLAFGSLSLIALSFGYAKKSFSKKHKQSQISKLLQVIDERVLETILLDKDYPDILYRLMEYQPLDPLSYDQLVKSIFDVITFLYKSKDSTTMKDNIEYTKLGHKIINSVRILRTMIQLKLPSAVSDFDEIAVDVQAKYDEDRENVLFDAQLRW